MSSDNRHFGLLSLSSRIVKIPPTRSVLTYSEQTRYVNVRKTRKQQQCYQGMDYDLYHLRWVQAGLSKEKTAELCGVSIRKYNNWESGRSKCPNFVYLLLKAYGAGHIPSLSRHWEGWRFINDELWSPNGVNYTSGDINSLFWLKQLSRTNKEQTPIQLVLEFQE